MSPLRASAGIRLCLDHGATSGVVMAYAARNRPTGSGPWGRWLDRRFLAYPGFVAVRDRRAALVAVLSGVIAATSHLRVVDLGCGTGEILLDVLAASSGRDAVVRGVDLDRAALGEAREAAAAAGVTARYDEGDALAPGVAAGAGLVLASGLYELLPAAQVRASLADLAATIAPGGRVVLAHQVSRPQPRGVGALVARLLPAGSVWPRDPAEVVAMVRAAGLDVETQQAAGQRYLVVVARKAG